MTKEELSKYRKITAEIQLIKRQLENAEPEFSTDSVTGSSATFPFTQLNIKISGYDTKSYERKVKRIENRLNRKLDELIEEKDKLTEYIYGLEDSDLRQILTYRYIEGLTWEGIGLKMDYGESSVRKKHNKFVQE